MALNETVDQASVPDTAPVETSAEVAADTAPVGETASAANAEAGATAADTARDVVASTEPVSESSTGSGEPTVPPSEAPSSPTAMPSVEDFDWDSWDMQLQNLPEVLHPWLRKVLTPYVDLHDQNQAKLAQTQQQYAEMKQMYDALLLGDEDPRVSKLTTDLQERDTRVAELEQQVAQNDQRYKDYIESESKEWTQNFLAVHSKTLQDERTLKVFQGFWRGIGDPHVAISIAKMPHEAQMVAARAMNDGTPAHIILQLAELKVSQIKGSAPTPRDSARFTNGADGAGMSPEQATADPLEGVNSLSDYRNAIAQRAFKAAKR